jgi:hypothetical protein
MCVDPLDPTGPGVSHGATPTRAVEYQLDTTTGTATLAWSHAPGRNAWFAGSARRVAYDNTLIGWAADKTSLATEVDKDDQVLWDIKTPAVAPQYMTYRAELITALTDEIRPVVTAGVPDGLVVTAGDKVAPEPGCTDRGGSNLQSCTTTGLTGGLLDTTTPGTRTWQVIAADGDGNTTTETRRYTVRSAWQPDGLIRKGGQDWWRGDGVHGPATEQTVRHKARPTRAKSAIWRVQNDGARADGFRLRGAGSTERFRVRYLAGGVDVTAAVVAGTYRTATLAPGASTSLRVKVTPTRRSRDGDRRTVVLRAISLADAAALDRVAVRVTVRR